MFRRPRHNGGADAIGGIAYRALHVVVPLVLIALVLATVDAGDVRARLTSVDPVWFLAALAACSAQIVISAFRWRLTARRLGVTISPSDAISEYYLSSAVNTTLPGGVVGDALRAVRMRGAAGLERAMHAVVIERLAGQVALAAVLVLGLVLSGRPELQWWALAITCLLAGLATLARLLRQRVAPLMPSVVDRFLVALRSSWFERRTALLQIALSLLIVALNLAAFSFAARATGAAIGAIDILFAGPLILTAMLIPFSVAGWGYREGAAAAVFPLVGASAAGGVSASLVFGMVILVASLPGLAVLLFRTKGAPQAARSQVSVPPQDRPSPS